MYDSINNKYYYYSYNVSENKAISFLKYVSL